MAPRWCCHGDTKVLFGVLFLRQTQLAGARDSFGAPLDLEFAKDLPIVSAHDGRYLQTAVLSPSGIAQLHDPATPMDPDGAHGIAYGMGWAISSVGEPS